MDGQEILGMSDEDFLAQMGTLQESASATSTEGSQTQFTEEVNPAAEEQGIEAEAQVQEAAQEQATETAPATEVATEATTQIVTGEATLAPGPEATTPAAAEPSKPAAEPTTPDAETAPTDYKAFHDQVMAPFQANGKTIQLRSVDEAIQLMQQGANYTRKMQAIA